MLRLLPVPNFQAAFDEDITGTAIAHIGKGLFEAHARDEAGFEDEAGHNLMWFAARDIAFDNPVTEDETARMLARMGITGPREVFEGNKGFKDTIAGPFVIDWAAEDLEAVRRTSLKKHNAEIHSQSAIDAALDIASRPEFVHDKISQVRITTFQVAYDIIGGGEEGDKQQIRTKEEADHSLPYMIAVALLDRAVQPPQYEPDRILTEDVQQLLKRVIVRPNGEYSARFPAQLPARVEVEFDNGTTLNAKQLLSGLPPWMGRRLGQSSTTLVLRQCGATPPACAAVATWTSVGHRPDQPVETGDQNKRDCCRHHLASISFRGRTRPAPAARVAPTESGVPTHHGTVTCRRARRRRAMGRRWEVGRRIVRLCPAARCGRSVTRVRPRRVPPPAAGWSGAALRRAVGALTERGVGSDGIEISTGSSGPDLRSAVAG
jgi:hypothetical protein